jgi:hypothetical protein
VYQAFSSAIVTATTVNGNSLVPAVKAEEGIDLSSTSVLDYYRFLVSYL